MASIISSSDRETSPGVSSPDSCRSPIMNLKYPKHDGDGVSRTENIRKTARNSDDCFRENSRSRTACPPSRSHRRILNRTRLPEEDGSPTGSNNDRGSELRSIGPVILSTNDIYALPGYDWMLLHDLDGSTSENTACLSRFGKENGTH
jgi:hypothetical protein